MSLVIQPILRHFRAVLGGSNDHDLRVLWEARYLMPKGDEGWIEIVPSR